MKSIKLKPLFTVLIHQDLTPTDGEDFFEAISALLEIAMRHEGDVIFKSAKPDGSKAKLPPEADIPGAMWFGDQGEN